MVKITKSENSVEIQVDTSTYLFTHAQYSELFTEMRTDPPEEIIWVSAVSTEDIDVFYTGDLVKELDDFVADTVMMYSDADEEDE